MPAGGPFQLGTIRFGVFELDPRAGELRKHGVKIKLQDQPFQVLQILLEKSGEVVTREELRQRVWPSGTFVDFEGGVYNAVKRLREALGDTADKPLFIETLPRKGYRFIAPVNGRPTATSNIPPVPKMQTLRWGVRLLAVGAVVLLLALWLRPPGLPKVIGFTQITNDGLMKEKLLTDGSRVYFTGQVAGHTILGQVSTSGGETSQIAAPFTTFHLLGLSPSRSELLLAGSFTDFGEGSPLWILPLPTGTPRRVGDIVANSAAWSPDGKHLLYSRGRDLYVSNHDGSQPRKLVSVPAYPVALQLSPDGSVVRFTAFDPQTAATSLWEVSRDGTGSHRLFSGGDDTRKEDSGNWTPDGRYYFFHSEGNVWALRENTGFLRKANKKPVQLTFGPLTLSNSVPSSDGKKLFAIGQHRRAEVVRYDPKSSQFVPYIAGTSGGQLDVSRDGKWVVYVAYPEETMWRSKADGSERQQLTHSPLRAALPRWSPDGKQIAFMASEGRKGWKIFLMSGSGGSPQDLLPGHIHVGDPSWSADGNSLAFGSLAADATSPPPAIRVLDLRTKRVSTVPGSDGMFSPRWSPNGRFLAALPADSQKLMIFDFTTQKWSTLADRAIGYPSWSKDSRHVFFDDTGLTDDPAFYRVSVSDRSLQRVVSLKDIQQFSVDWPLGFWTGLTADDFPLLQRDISVQEIYALDLHLP